MSFKTIVFTFFLLSGIVAKAQYVDYPLAIADEKLVNYMANLAWLNNPANDNYFQDEVIAKERVKMAKRGWWRNIGVTFNLNEYSKFGKKDTTKPGPEPPIYNDPRNNIFFPKYNFSAFFDLGSIFDTPNKTKIAQRKVIQAESTTQQAKKDTRAKVIQMYQEYLTAIEILKIRYKSESDMRANYEVVSELFNSGDSRVSFTDVNSASLALNNAKESRIKANKMVTIAKMKLEDFIGVKLEAVEAKFKEKR